MSTQSFLFNNPFTLENGVTLPSYHLAYTTLGQLNKSKDNVIWIFHALTANSNPAEWWPGLVGENKFFDPSRHFIVCVNMPGSCYGSIGPLDVKPGNTEQWFHDFPLFTTRDMIRAYQPLKQFLGIEKIRIGIGGSMGGQQLLEWAVEEPDLFEYIFPIATNAQHSPWGIAFNASQRMCIEADTSWPQRQDHAGIHGLKAARSLALLSYRHYDAYNITQPRDKRSPWPTQNNYGGEAAESYQRYQGEKLARRFNAFSYYRLSQGMDSHDLARERGPLKEVLKSIRAKTLAIGIQSDILFPVQEQQLIADTVPGASIAVIESPFGHDGFLLEFDAISRLLKDFTETNTSTHYLKIVNE